MTTHTVTPNTRNRTVANWPAFATASIGISSVLTAIGTFWSPLADYETRPFMEDLGSWLFCVGVALAGAAIVFGLVVRKATAANASKRAILLAALGVLSIAVFWTGLPMIFVGGAACCAAADRGSAMSKVALVLGALTTAAVVWLALAG